MTTAHLGLDLPIPGGDVDDWGTKLNDAFQAVDDASGFSVKAFIAGAGGDHYLGWKALIAAVNAAGTGSVLVDVDTFVEEFRITGGTNANAITDLQFLNVVGLTIFGMGHKFEVKGDFNREKQTDEGGASATLSFEQTLYLLFTDCEDVLVRDLELDGNVDLMTRDVGVTEGPSSGLFFQGCKRVLLDNIDTHHWMADGVKFGASASSTPRRACELVGMRNVRSHNNARQALSPIQVRGLHAVGCEFVDTGRTEGSYLNHAPSSGCDIEPTLHADTGAVDVETGLILIESSDITGNIGGTILCAQPKVDRVAVRNSRLTHPDDGGNSAGIFSCKGFVLDGCDLDAGDSGDFVFSDGVGNLAYRFRMRGGSLRCGGDSKGAVADDNLSNIVVEDVAFVSDATAPVAGGGQFPFFTSNKIKLRYCSFFYPAAYFGGAAGASWRVGTIKNGESVGNTFDTDFVPTTTEYMYVDTSGSGGGITIARNDHYKNSAAKPIRPFLNSTDDPAYPFSRGPSNLGDSPIWRALSNQTNTVVFDDHAPTGAAPSGGSWAKGDRVFNSNPSELGSAASKYVISGWICTAAGSPGTWLQMRTLTGN